MLHQSSDDVLISALKILAREIVSGDGVATAAITEAAIRLDELASAVRLTVAENGHLADGDNCTLWRLVKAVA